jgi:hypothetical protein
MQSLNLPTYSFKIKSVDRATFIFDAWRKKYIRLTPEEWVRQNFARFLVEERAYPAGRMVMEKSLRYNNMVKRCDILVYGPSNPLVLVECKAPEVKIEKQVFDQIATYNLAFQVEYLLVSNGLKHYACRVDFEEKKVKFLNDIPEYPDICRLE